MKPKRRGQNDAEPPDAISLGGERLNCWEHTRCGREPGGSKVDELGVCLAAVDGRLDGVHGGRNAGRCCWVVAGTFCEGRVQGTFAQKYANCEACEFYQRVQREEGPGAKQADTLLLYLSSSEAAERRRYEQILTSVMDPSVVPLALDNLDALKRGEERNITAFFSDIASSSVISERLQGSEFAGFLNEYFSAMADILKAEGGTIDKYVGDGMVGIFGAPAALENHALAAARAALRMQRRVGELRSEWKQGKIWCPEAWSLRVRIGLNSGQAKVGFFGTHDLMTYSMIGSTVNTAKRFEQVCAHLGVSILVGGATRNLIADQIVLRRLDRIHLEGRARAEPTYEILGERGLLPAEEIRAAEVFDTAQDLYDRRRWAEAADLFRQALQMRGGDDPPALRLWRLCERLRDAER
jgi:adenylate cyclase